MKHLFFCLFALLCATQLPAQAELSGEIKKWHKITLTVEGPKADEQAKFNPFFHYRMDVTFRHDSATYVVPGYFAADGDAGTSGATGGTKWRAHFSPDQTGEWTYSVSFRTGSNVAVRDNPRTGEAVTKVDGLTGSFTVRPTDKSGRDLRAKGRLLFHGRQYPVWAETGDYFYKVGVDAPENLLAYADFDGNFKTDGYKDDLIKTWAAHTGDWRTGDPTWGKDERGKALIGGINYLAGEGLNAFSFLTLNIAGDDENVFPYVDHDNYERIDVSKMDQWEVLFTHGERQGMFLHFKMAEVENQGLLDGGDLGLQRKLYYRELIARFGHHLALNWNVGEENGRWKSRQTTPYQTTVQRLAMARYFYDNDPYRHHVVIHNGQSFYDLFGFESKYSGISLQTNKPDFRNVYPDVRHWLSASRQAGCNWAVAVDEPGDAQHSLVPDADNPGHDDARQNALWGSLMAGAWGTEWYFGYKHAHSDLSCEDWRSRDLFWDQCRHLLTFLRENEIPLPEMKPANDLSSNDQDWVLAKEGDIYIILVKAGEKGENNLTVPEGRYNSYWFDPRSGKVIGRSGFAEGKEVKIGTPPGAVDKDWVLLVREGDR